MKSVWTWGGKFFGHIDGDDLWTYDGKHVGKLKGDEIYGRDGQYLGEIMNDDRLITNNAKRHGGATHSLPTLGALVLYPTRTM